MGAFASGLSAGEAAAVEDVPVLLKWPKPKGAGLSRWQQQNLLGTGDLHEQIVEAIKVKRAAQRAVAQPEVGELDTRAHEPVSARRLKRRAERRQCIQRLVPNVSRKLPLLFWPAQQFESGPHCGN